MRGSIRRMAGVATAVAVVAGAVLFAAAAPSRATAAAVYVGGVGCSDSNSGTQAAPLCTIGNGVALAAATPGTSVWVNPGTYPEQVTIPASGTASQPFTVAAVTPGTVTVSGGAHGFVVANRSYVTINGFNVTATLAEGFDLSASSNLTISHDTVSGAGAQIQGRDASGFLLNGVTASILSADHADHNSLHGFELTGTTSGVTVSGGEASFNAEGWQRGATGIDVRAAGNTIVGNVLHDNEDAGLRFAPGSDSGTAAANVVYDNGDAGIDAVDTSNGAITGNTVFHNCATGISVRGQSARFVVENNIAVDNAVYPAYNSISCHRRGGNIGVFDAATSGAKLDYNEVFLSSASGSQYLWAGTAYSTLSGFQAAVAGQSGHDLQADPKFAAATTNPADAATWNLHLTESSPAIDSADSSVPGEQALDADGNVRVDDPNVPNTGAGPRAFDDRGAYEFMSPTVVGGPTAALSVSPPSGVVPLVVTADASASTAGAAAIASYSFDFGDGSPTAKTGPQAGATANHTYASAGTYTVTVTVKDSAGLPSSATKTVTVTPAPPTAVLKLSTPGGVAPLSVTADATGSVKGSGAITSYTFDFGDGSATAKVGPQAAATASHVYSTTGTFAVTVTVTDANNLTATATQSVVVGAALPPTAALSLSATAGAAPLVVTADASATKAGSSSSLSYSFNFGDGSPVVGPQPGATATHTFTTAGTFTVKVTVTDGNSLTSNASQQATITYAPPTAALTVAPTAGVVPMAVTADASGTKAGSSTALSYSFDFGDGSAVVGPQSTATASHTYTAAGTYTVKVTVTDGNNLTSTASQQVTATLVGPTAALKVTPSIGSIPLNATADASASKAGSGAITGYTFDFGDGTATVGPQQAATATHSYTTAGTFTVKVTITDANGLSATLTKTVGAWDPPKAALKTNTASGMVPIAVTADASGTKPGSSTTLSYSFDFGDGSAVVGPQSTATANHTYTTAGAYTLTVTVTDGNTLTSTATQSITALSGAVGRWKLNDGAVSVGADKSGHGYNVSPTNAGVTWNYDHNGTAMFNEGIGRGNLQTNGSILNNTAAFTVSAWAWIDPANTGGTILGEDGVNEGAFMVYYYVDATTGIGQWRFAMPRADAAGALWDQAGATTGTNRGVWHHVVATYDGTSAMTLWIDGTKAATSTHTPDHMTLGDFTIGRDWHGSPNSYWTGKINQVQAYSTVLTDSQITGLYNSPTTSYTGVVGWWPLNDGAVSTVKDTSGYGHNGSLYGDWVSLGADHNGSAVFNGQSWGQISTKPAIDTSRSFTVTAWAKLTATGKTADVVAQSGQQASGFYLQYDSVDNAWAFTRCPTDTASCSLTRAHAATAPAVGAWTHLAGTYDAATGTMTLYVNGQAAGTATDTTPFNATVETVIGRGTYNGAYVDWFTGAIADVQEFQRVLSPSEISTIYSAG